MSHAIIYERSKFFFFFFIEMSTAPLVFCFKVFSGSKMFRAQSISRKPDIRESQGIHKSVRKIFPWKEN